MYIFKGGKGKEHPSARHRLLEAPGEFVNTDVSNEGVGMGE